MCCLLIYDSIYHPIKSTHSPKCSLHSHGSLCHPHTKSENVNTLLDALPPHPWFNISSCHPSHKADTLTKMFSSYPQLNVLTCHPPTPQGWPIARCVAFPSMTPYGGILTYQSPVPQCWYIARLVSHLFIIQSVGSWPVIHPRRSTYWPLYHATVGPRHYHLKYYHLIG